MDALDKEFVDRMGLALERLGGTRTMGRLWAWLMVCDPPHQSLTDLAAALGVSKTAVSTVARYLEAGAILERVPVAGRQHHYRVAAGGWEQLLADRTARMQPLIEALETGLSVVGADRPEQRALLEETRDFYAFTARDGANVVERWKQYRYEQAQHMESREHHQPSKD
ncbi:hypothetical protein [Nonomuraea longicatena]|uniref:Siderophore transport transcriptional regulator MmpR5 n=1 Tax=Nonomuraea longicatena TaxID=83682 RepID=A0ABN1Q3C5_9ACTN